MSFFEAISSLPDDPIFGLFAAFQADPRPEKINLAIGIYQDGEGKVPLLASVRKAEEEVLALREPKVYLPIDGSSDFLKATLKLIFGSLPDSCTAVQSIGGTGGLSVGAQFLQSQGFQALFLPEPSWSNHKQIFGRAGLKVASYSYYDPVEQKLDFAGICRSIRSMPTGSILLLHCCCHNPTGIDPSQTEWQEIETLVRKQRLLPFFDVAYQGFGAGIEADVWPIRYFAEKEHEILVSCSFSKNFSLYGERVGLLAILSSQKKIASHLKPIIRSTYSNPPHHGARLIAHILQNPSLKQLWEEELGQMRERLAAMRRELLRGLQRKPSEQQRGLFYMSGLSNEMVKRLREEKAVYLLDNGRLNLAGLNPANLPFVTQALLEVST